MSPNQRDFGYWLTARTRNLQRSSRSGESAKNAIHDRQQSASFSRRFGRMNFVLIIIIGIRIDHKVSDSTMDIDLLNTLDYSTVHKVVILGCIPLSSIWNSVMRFSCEMDWHCQDDSLLGNGNPTTPDHHNATHPGTSQHHQAVVSTLGAHCLSSPTSPRHQRDRWIIVG